MGKLEQKGESSCINMMGSLIHLFIFLCLFSTLPLSVCFGSSFHHSAFEPLVKKTPSSSLTWTCFYPPHSFVYFLPPSPLFPSLFCLCLIKLMLITDLGFLSFSSFFTSLLFVPSPIFRSVIFLDFLLLPRSLPSSPSPLLSPPCHLMSLLPPVPPSTPPHLHLPPFCLSPLLIYTVRLFIPFLPSSSSTWHLYHPSHLLYSFLSPSSPPLPPPLIYPSPHLLHRSISV